MADISCVEDALASEESGADWIGTTLAGYTKHGRPKTPGPDLELISILAERIGKPIIAEGRISEPAQVGEALERGAFAVVIGTAITRPQDITRRFVAALP
jgi:N-acylglucosamine-6-phosphate 2-epimerase